MFVSVFTDSAKFRGLANHAPGDSWQSEIEIVQSPQISFHISEDYFRGISQEFTFHHFPVTIHVESGKSSHILMKRT